MAPLLLLRAGECPRPSTTAPYTAVPGDEATADNSLWWGSLFTGGTDYTTSELGQVTGEPDKLTCIPLLPTGQWHVPCARTSTRPCLRLAPPTQHAAPSRSASS
jgi:hypothetical protein